MISLSTHSCLIRVIKWISHNSHSSCLIRVIMWISHNLIHFVWFALSFKHLIILIHPFLYPVPQYTTSIHDGVSPRRDLVLDLPSIMAPTGLEYTVQLCLLRETACCYSHDESLLVTHFSFGQVKAQSLIDSSVQEVVIKYPTYFSDEEDTSSDSDHPTSSHARLGISSRKKYRRTKKMSRELVCRKSAGLWRTIILSSLNKTLYPYSRYIRVLNLRGLDRLFTHEDFEGTTRK